jgi:hypothetical protein
LSKQEETLNTPRIRSLSVKGFRAYGAAEQILNLPSNIAVVWGPNSKGKTSLAEAFEFLLTGHTSRRELMASSQDEFAEALRNAHLSAGEEVYVGARIIAADGTAHEIKRILTSDYTKRQDCTSRLEIDGAVATEAALTKFGIVLSQPPLQAPVLAQHTLGYIFSVGPQNRSTYFKTLLEVTDLDILRNDIAALADELKTTDSPLLIKLETCAGVPSLQPALDSVLSNIPNMATLTVSIEDAARALIEANGEQVPATLNERLAAIERILADIRSKTFPVRGFEQRELADWNPPHSDIWSLPENYLKELKKVDEETRKLVAIFDEALKLPAISKISEPLQCPLCGTEATLTPERVQIIRQQVEASKEFKAAEAATKTSFSQLSVLAEGLAIAAEAALPRYFKMTVTQRREAGFTVPRIRELLGDRAAELADPWLSRIMPLARASADLRRGALAAVALVKKQIAEMSTTLDPEKLRTTFSALATLHAAYATAIDSYKVPTAVLNTALNEILDRHSDTAGWQEFLDIAREPANLRIALIERAACAVVGREFDEALKQIDRAKEQVLDDKFSDFSILIQAWWERLRPDEQTFFSTVQPRKGAKRTIDFKAGLSASPDRSTPKLRDVIAVFSQSQLHCLGLAMFLARAQHEGFCFIILDDPVQSSDEDYRVHFNTTVLTELLEIPMQVIVITQDHVTWEEAELRYRHLSISTAQLYIETSGEGSIIENTSDALLAMINRATSLARGGHPDVRKVCGVQLRDAGERFCKEILINDRKRKGETAASLTDYDGKTLGWLSPRVEPLLDHDASHPGKLEVFKNTVNNACHDNAPPSNVEMTQACGEIRFLAKDYLGR